MSATQPADDPAELPAGGLHSPGEPPRPDDLPTPLELSRALLELGPRLATASTVEAIIEAVAQVLARALSAAHRRSSAEPSPADPEVHLADEARRSGRVRLCRVDEAGPCVLLLPICRAEPPFELLAFQRQQPFSELEQNLAELARAALEAELERRALSRELADCRTQLAQSERLKLVGQLASGVAHDFNNLLMVISAAAEVIADAYPPEQAGASHLTLILDTSQRAAELTRKLLRFSRKAVPAIKLIDLHDVLGAVREFLSHAIDRRIRLELSLCDAPCVVDADPTELHSAILNVCLNARDAMPEGGVLELTTSRVELDAHDCATRFRGCQPGAFVRLDIRDTGTGMDAQTLALAFQPFFTTKEPGRGTGLGLPVVLAAVREHKGGVLLESELGAGTLCSIFLPLSESALAESSSSSPDSRRTRALRVLLVDDEPDVCLTTAQLMRQLGHNVQALCSGDKALSHLRVHSGGYDLLVLDIMMPHPTGIEVHQALARAGIELPTIFMSGSPGLGLTGTLADASGAVVLAKPFRQAELALAIARCVEAWQSREGANAPVLRAG